MVGLYQWKCTNSRCNVTKVCTNSERKLFSGNYKNGCVDTSVCVVVDKIGIDTKTLNNVSILPNPTQAVVTISFEGLTATVAIIDVKGRLLKTVSVNSGDQIDLSNFETGLYLFDITSNSKRTIERVIKN